MNIVQHKHKKYGKRDFGTHVVAVVYKTTDFDACDNWKSISGYDKLETTSHLSQQSLLCSYNSLDGLVSLYRYKSIPLVSTIYVSIHWYPHIVCGFLDISIWML